MEIKLLEFKFLTIPITGKFKYYLVLLSITWKV